MKVVHFSKYYSPYLGGVETVVKDIASGLIENCTVLAVDSDRLPQQDFISGVKIVRSKELFKFASTSIAPSYISNAKKNIKADVLHIHLPNPLANLSVLLLDRFIDKNTKIICHWHSDIVKQKKLLKLYKPLQDWLLRRSSLIIVTSPNYLDDSQHLKPFKDKCVVIPIGIGSISPRVSKSKVSSIKNRYPGKKIVFSLGRHIYYKGFEYLIESAKSIDNAVFLLGGTGPDTDVYRSLIKKHSLENKVILIGRVSEQHLPSYYDAADVFCLPSIEKSEAFGVVQLEAMSVSTPVVSTNIKGSGVPWVNRHMESGLVCEPCSSEDLAGALSLILNDDGLRARLSLGALNRFTKFFTKEQMNDSISKVYNS